MRGVPAPLESGPRPNLKGLYLVVPDQALAPELIKRLEQSGATVALLPPALLNDLAQLRQAVEQWRERCGPIAGMVLLSVLNAQPPDSLTTWRQQTQTHIKGVFQLLQLCAIDYSRGDQDEPFRIVATSQMGGCFGRDHNLTLQGLAGGGYTGLLKCLTTEATQVQAKAIDLDPALSAVQGADIVLAELLSPGRLEVGYPGGKRTVFATVEAPLPKTQLDSLVINEDWVVLVTGGARGITAEVLTELAPYGLRLVLVGKSPLPGSEPVDTEGIDEEALLKKALILHMQAQHSQPGQQPPRLLPAEINHQIQELRRNRAVRHNLERLRQLGAEVEYHAVDGRDGATLGQLVDDLYRQYGRIDAVIHGAGIIEDKLIADKSLASFERVFDTKVDSAFTLSLHLRPDSLQLMVLFSSVAGRYGNRGQADYAAANEVMTRLAWDLDRRWPKTRVLSLCWGPWDTTGMASEAVKQQFRARGIEPIPLASGRRFFLEELLYGSKGDTEVVAGGGPWEAYEQSLAREPLSQSQIALSSGHSTSAFWLLPGPPQSLPNGAVVVEATLSLLTAPYLYDHRLEGRPVLPATAALEWLAELVQAGWPDWVVSEVRNLRVLRGVVLSSETDTARLRLQALASTHADAAELLVTASIEDADRQLPMYRAQVVLRSQLVEPPPMVWDPIPPERPLSPGMAYRDYLFHGPRFQLVQSIEAIAEQGVDAWVTPSDGATWVSCGSQGSWLFDPGLLDTAPQLAIAWARLYRDTTPLPSCLTSVVRYAVSAPPGPLQLRLRLRQVEENSIVYDAVFCDHNQQVHLAMTQIESTCNPALNRLAGNSHG
jgi:NAD(P)-dependent dehydrogenase (short-subunit alcohol dehydrogenase family)